MSFASRNKKSDAFQSNFRDKLQSREAKKSRPLKGTSRVHTECTYQISSPKFNSEENHARNKFKKWEKTTKKKTHIRGSKEMKVRCKVEIYKRHIYSSYWMYLPHFNFLAQFGGELNEVQILKIKKIYQKSTYLELWGSEMGLKSRNTQKALLGTLSILHT